MIRTKSPQEKYKMARINLLMMVLLTCVNILLILVDSDRSFPFSAFLPQFFFFLGLNKVTGVPAFNTIGSALFITLGTLIILFFLLSYIFSKKKPGWMITALVLFSIDCLIFIIMALQTFEPSYMIDILFHVWVMYYLIVGVKYSEYATLLPEIPEGSLSLVYDGTAGEAENKETSGALSDTKSLGFPVEANKEKILISASVHGMEIQVRRTRRLIELIINGNVYAIKEEKLVQQNYRIGAVLGGHKIETEYNQSSQVLYVDNLQVERKLRLI
ncbi:MAG: hypothetical protein PHW77_01520 [Eubacteriales bacterium]|nr:hypothetical protein [Eubacteriales bacterium]